MATQRTVIVDAEVGGAIVDVTIEGGRIERLGRGAGRDADEVVDAQGGALLPGLHDHHIHLFALAAARASVACGPPTVETEADLRRALAAVSPGADGWIRGFGYHARVAGASGRRLLDGIRADVPVRIQDASGQAWAFNSAGLRQLGVEDSVAGPPGLERVDGRATGMLYREDDWLRERLGGRRPALGEVSRELAGYGITGVTDASVGNGADEVDAVDRERRTGRFGQRVWWMGGADLARRRAAAPRKLIVDDARLPAPDELAERVTAAHREGRAVAFHCVTRAELAVACAALEQAGPRPGDRFEHAFVAPPDLVAWVARLGATVVVQPGFLAERGDRYLADVDPPDRPWLLPGAAWSAAGVAMGGGSDAPYGPADPWCAMRAAVQRETRAGVRLRPEEALSPERALALFTTAPQGPGGAPRELAEGKAADLCLLDVPWERARRELSSTHVRAAFVAGRRLPAD